MTRDDVITMQAALDRYIHDLSIQTNDSIRELERARELRDRASAAIDVSDVHVRDEDLVPEVVRPGDLLVVSTSILQEWIEHGPSTVMVMVKHITRDPETGAKTVVVSAPMVNG